MILQVEFSQFAATAKRLIQAREAFVAPQGKGALVSAADSVKGISIQARVPGGAEEAKRALEKEGFEVFEGIWSDASLNGAVEEENREVFVAAVAYASREKMPGLWMDAYPSEPVPGAVLRAFYDELAGNGEIPEVSFEEFVRLAEPNVLIIGPSEIQSFLDAKENC